MFDLDLPNRFQDFITLSLSIFVEALPFLILGSLLAALVRTLLPDDFFQNRLPKNPFARRISISFLGFLLPVCECGNVPLTRSLISHGFKPSEAITFLLAAPVINPVTIWSTWAAFGGDSAVVSSRIVATLLIANGIGYILSRRKNEKEYLTKSFSESITTSHKHQGQPMKEKIHELSRVFTIEAMLMAKMLAFGVLVAGAVQSFVPRDVLVSIGSNVILSILAMLLLAFVVSICANVDAFFALSFANTFTTGSIVSFLVFGPMIDIKMLALLKTTFTTRTLILISGLALIASYVTGLVVTYAL